MLEREGEGEGEGERGVLLKRNDMTGEEVGGPAAPKVLRLLYFVGAGFICTAAINKWRQLERKAMLQKQQENRLPEHSANAVQKAVD